MSKEAIELVQSYGIEIVEGQDLNIEEAKAKISEHYRTSLIENEDFISTIPKDKLPQDWFEHDSSEDVKAALSKHYGMSKKALRTTYGVTDEMYNGIPEDIRSDFNKLAPYIYEHFGATTTEGEADEWVKKYAKLEQERNEIASKLESTPSEIRAELEAEFNEKLFNSGLKSKTSQLQQHFPASAEFIVPGVIGKLKAKYDIKDEGGSYVFYEKGKQTRVRSTADASQKLGLKEAVKLELGSDWKELEKEKVVQTGTAQITPAKSTKTMGRADVNDAYAQKLAAEKNS